MVISASRSAAWDSRPAVQIRNPPSGRSSPATNGSDGVTATRRCARIRTSASSVHRSGSRSQAESDSGWLPATQGPSTSATIACRARASWRCTAISASAVPSSIQVVAISPSRLTALQLRDAQDAGGADAEPRWHHEVADPQPGHDRLGEAGREEAEIRQQRGDRRQLGVQQGFAHLVLDDENAVPARDFRDGLAPLRASQMAGRVAERGDQHQRRHLARGAGRFECFDQDAFAVGRQAAQGKAQHVGQADDAVIGQPLGEHHIARPHHGCHRQEQRVRGPVGDQDAIGVRLHPEAAAASAGRRRGADPDRRPAGTGA